MQPIRLSLQVGPGVLACHVLGMRVLLLADLFTLAMHVGERVRLVAAEHMLACWLTCRQQARARAAGISTLWMGAGWNYYLNLAAEPECAPTLTASHSTCHSSRVLPPVIQALLLDAAWRCIPCLKASYSRRDSSVVPTC